MPVQRSPFSTGNTPPTPTSDPITQIGQVDTSKAWKAPVDANTTVDKGDGTKTSLNQEKGKLDKAYSSALAKIARSNMSDKQKFLERQKVDQIYKKGFYKGKMSLGFDAITNPVKSVFHGLQTVSQAGQSLLKEMDDYSNRQMGPTASKFNPANPLGMLKLGLSAITTDEQKKKNEQEIQADKNLGPVQYLKKSMSDFHKQTFDPKFKMVQTGHQLVDNAIDLGADVVFDPTTWMGVGPLNYVGKAGRSELLIKFGTSEMLTKYPELVGKLDDIARYGVDAIPKTVRDAEGIQQGIRFAGKIVPHTEGAARLVSGRYGVATNVRAGVGDFINKFDKLKGAREFMTPASRVGLVAKNVGRGKGVEDKVVLQEIAHYTSARWAKGFKAEQFDRGLKGIVEDIKQLRKTGGADYDNFYKYVENPQLMDLHGVKQELRDTVMRYKGWQDELRTGVNSIYQKFNLDFGDGMIDVGFIDDYLHHKMTDKALSWAYGAKGKASGWFNDADLSEIELGRATGSAMHRKIEVGSNFMGEVVDMNYDGIAHDSLTDVVNYIFKKKSGMDFNFFSTDIGEISQSYAYSMANARGREAYFRRMYDFGPDFIQTINYKLVPDKELLAQLKGTHSSMLAIRRDLLKRVNRGRALLTDTAKNAVESAQAVLDSKMEDWASVVKNIEVVKSAITKLEARHMDALVAASKKGVAERGAFMEAHKVLLEEIQALRSAIETGQVNELVAKDMLTDIYRKTFPNAKRVPKSAQKMIDAINRVNGVADTAALRELEKRLAGLRQQMALVPKEDVQQLNELLDIENELVQQIQGHTVLGNVRLDADYAPDGLVYGYGTDLTPAVTDPNARPYRVLSTNPVGGVLPEGASVDEIANATRSFMMDPSSVAVHAPRADEIHDMRLVEHFQQFFDPENGIGDAIHVAMDNAGLDGTVWGQAWDELVQTGELDPMFEQVYGEMAQLMETLGAIHSAPHTTGVVDDNFIAESFNSIRESLQSLAAMHGLEDADLVGSQMMDDVLGYMADEVVGKPFLVPDSIIQKADDGYSLIVPEKWSYLAKRGEIDPTKTTSAVQSPSQSEFIQSIMHGDLESEALAASESLTAVADKTAELQGIKSTRDTLKQEANNVSRQIGGAKSAASRRVKAAEKAYKDYAESGMVTVTLGGKARRMTRDQALDVLNKREMNLHAKVARLEERIAKIDGRKIESIEMRIQRQRERLASLFDQKAVLQRWNDTTGNALREEIDMMRQMIAVDPPTGGMGTTSRQWSERVGRNLQAIDKMRGTKEYDAFNRVFTQLYADEVQLAHLDLIALPNVHDAIRGAKLDKLVPDILDGWKRIENTGLQMPKDLYDVVFPNIKKLQNKAEMHELKKAWFKTLQAFKIYATMSVGFLTRNAMSAVFMNHVAGVESKTMIKGIDAVMAYRKFGPDRWLDELGIVDDAMRETYSSAMRASQATGRGLSSEFDNPMVSGTFFDRHILENKATKWFSDRNSFVEDAVRFPMALDTILKGGSYDEAIYRVTRYHFDYSDLSKLDTAAKRLAVPFWVWTVRNIPLQLTEQILRPSTYSIYNQIQEHNPVSADIIMPAWMQETNPMGVGGNWVVAPDLPMVRLEQQIGQITNPSKLAGTLYPQIKVPLEIMADKQLATNIPFTDKFQTARGLDRLIAQLGDAVGAGSVGYRDKNGDLVINPRLSYALGNLIPPIATSQRLTGGYLGGKDTYNERQLSSILSWLGVPARQVGEREQRAATIGKQFDIASALKDIGRKNG